MRLLLKDSASLAQLEDDAEAELGMSKSTGWRKLQALMVQLRKCCLHPYLFDEADYNPGCIDEDLIYNCGKLQILDALLRRLKAKGHRVVLFSQMTKMLDILEDFLNLRNYAYCRLDGSKSRVHRTVEINSFNDEGSQLFCFLMTTRSGGLGINLQTADTVILYDSDWNPQPDLQAMARVHRIGQTKVVHVYRLVTRGTIEEKIVDHADNKLYLDKMVNSKQVTDEATEDDEASTKDMLNALSFGAQAVAGLDSTTDPPTDDELDAIINRNRTSNESIGDRLVGGTENKAGNFEVSEAKVSIRQLNGKIYGLGDSKKSWPTNVVDIAKEWDLLSQDRVRKRKARTETVHVAGVGAVNVLKDAKAARIDGDVRERQSARQVAGRDYEHSKTCQCCWKEGDMMIKCTQCPAAFHAECLGLDSGKGLSPLWRCSHHQCGICSRKAGAAGGLLFRCSMCPRAFCEDHLPKEAIVVKQCPRFQKLGFNHPTSGCYIFCSERCVELAKEHGLAAQIASHGSAGTILGSVGVDLTAGGTAHFDRRSDWEKLTPTVQAALVKSLQFAPSSLGSQAPGFVRRCLENVDSHHSTLDMLHDVLYDTNLYSQRERSKAIDVFMKCAEWNGVAEYHPYEPPIPELQINDFDDLAKRANTDASREFYAYAGKKQKQALEKIEAKKLRNQARQAAAATEFLRIIRALEALSSKYQGGLKHAKQIAALLGVGRLPSKLPQCPSEIKLLSASSEHLFAATSLYLVWPRECSLYLGTSPANPNQAGGHYEVLSDVTRPAGIRIAGGKFLHSHSQKPCCRHCGQRFEFLIIEGVCYSCTLANKFGQRPKENVQQSESTSEWPAKGCGPPTLVWVAEGGPFQQVFDSCILVLQSRLQMAGHELLTNHAREEICQAISKRLSELTPDKRGAVLRYFAKLHEQGNRFSHLQLANTFVDTAMTLLGIRPVMHAFMNAVATFHLSEDKRLYTDWLNNQQKREGSSFQDFMQQQDHLAHEWLQMQQLRENAASSDTAIHSKDLPLNSIKMITLLKQELNQILASTNQSQVAAVKKHREYWHLMVNRVTLLTDAFKSKKRVWETWMRAQTAREATQARAMQENEKGDCTLWLKQQIQREGQVMSQMQQIGMQHSDVVKMTNECDKWLEGQERQERADAESRWESRRQERHARMSSLASQSWIEADDRQDAWVRTLQDYMTKEEECVQKMWSGAVSSVQALFKEKLDALSMNHSSSQTHSASPVRAILPKGWLKDVQLAEETSHKAILAEIKAQVKTWIESAKKKVSDHVQLRQESDTTMRHECIGKFERELSEMRESMPSDPQAQRELITQMLPKYSTYVGQYRNHCLQRNTEEAKEFQDFEEKRVSSLRDILKRAEIKLVQGRLAREQERCQQLKGTDAQGPNACAASVADISDQDVVKVRRELNEAMQGIQKDINERAQVLTNGRAGVELDNTKMCAWISEKIEQFSGITQMQAQQNQWLSAQYSNDALSRQARRSAAEKERLGHVQQALSTIPNPPTLENASFQTLSTFNGNGAEEWAQKTAQSNPRTPVEKEAAKAATKAAPGLEPTTVPPEVEHAECDEPEPAEHDRGNVKQPTAQLPQSEPAEGAADRQPEEPPLVQTVPADMTIFADWGPPEEDRIPIWNCTTKRKLGGKAAPKWRNLAQYLRKHPECALYTGQDKLLTALEKQAQIATQNRIPVWNKSERRVIRGNAAPMADNLDKYLREHPECELYTGQDKLLSTQEKQDKRLFVDKKLRFDQACTVRSPTSQGSPRASQSPLKIAAQEKGLQKATKAAEVRSPTSSAALQAASRKEVARKAEDEVGLHNAVAVSWSRGKLYDAIVIEVLQSSHSLLPKFKVQFDVDSAIATVSRKQIKMLTPADPSMLHDGICPGELILAQDPYNEADTAWHQARLELALLAVDGRRVRFWVRFEASGAGQWCWAEHVRRADSVISDRVDISAGEELSTAEKEAERAEQAAAQALKEAEAAEAEALAAEKAAVQALKEAEEAAAMAAAQGSDGVILI